MSQTGKLLNLLKRRGWRGATNVELNRICFRYSARLFELRRDGYHITTENLKYGVFKYTLVAEPEL